MPFEILRDLRERTEGGAYSACPLRPVHGVPIKGLGTTCRGAVQAIGTVSRGADQAIGITCRGAVQAIGTVVQGAGQAIRSLTVFVDEALQDLGERRVVLRGLDRRHASHRVERVYAS